MHPALKKALLTAVVFAALLIGLPFAGRLIQRGILSLDQKAVPALESESELTSILDEKTSRYITLEEVAKKGSAVLPVQELMETKIPYTDKEKEVLARSSPLLISEPAPYGKEGAAFLSSEEEKEQFLNLVILFCAYNFGEKAYVKEIEFADLLYYDTVVLQYKAAVRLSDEGGGSAELVLAAGHNLDEAIFYITTQFPEYFDYEITRDETETEWEDLYA